MESTNIKYFFSFKAYKLLLLVCVFLCLKSSSFQILIANLSGQEIHHLQQIVKRGDLILREGTAGESAIIKQLSGSSFSHIGIIAEVTPTIKIIHATTDDNPYQLNQVIESSIIQFTHSSLANQWQIYRLNLHQNEVDYLLKQTTLQKGSPFKLQVRNKQGLYCTTLISNYLPIPIQKQLHWQKIDIPAMNGELLFPQSFLEIEDIELVYKSS